MHKVSLKLNLCKILLHCLFSKSLFYTVNLLWIDHVVKNSLNPIEGKTIATHTTELIQVDINP